MLITNLGMSVEQNVTKVVQMAHKVAVMAKESNYIELSQNWYMT